MPEQELPIHPYSGLTALGLTKSGRPIWPIVGAADDDDDQNDVDVDTDEPDDDADDNNTDAGSGDGKPEDKPNPLKLALDKERKARRAADRELKALRAKNESDSEKSVREAEEAATAAADARYKPALVRSAAKAEFAALGAPVDKPEKFSRLIKMLDLDDIEIDEDGEITGLTEQVKQLRTEWPELFGKVRAPRGDTANRTPTGEKKTTGQKYAEAYGG